MIRTTVLAEEHLILEARALAAQQGTTLTQVVHEALALYIAANRKRGAPSIVGIGESGESDVSERSDEILRSEIDPIAGWSPRRSGADQAAEPSER